MNSRHKVHITHLSGRLKHFRKFERKMPILDIYKRDNFFTFSQTNIKECKYVYNIPYKT